MVEIGKSLETHHLHRDVFYELHYTGTDWVKVVRFLQLTIVQRCSLGKYGTEPNPGCVGNSLR